MAVTAHNYWEDTSLEAAEVVRLEVGRTRKARERGIVLDLSTQRCVVGRIDQKLCVKGYCE